MQNNTRSKQLERAVSIKKAILENNGFVEYEIGGPSEKLEYFAVVSTGSQRHVVTLPKQSNTPNTISKKKRFFGDMWIIKMINNKPTVTSKSLHTMSRHSANIRGAILGFNNHHKNATYDRMEIVEFVKL